MNTRLQDLPNLLRVGEKCRRQLRLSRQQIIDFANLTGDLNPLHHDTLAAQRADFGEIIACGQHTVSLLIGLVASHFAQPGESGPREVLCLNFNFAFKAPVFADQTLSLAWTVMAVDPSARQSGWIAQVDGLASIAGRACVIGRGTLLVRQPGSGDGAPATEPGGLDAAE